MGDITSKSYDSGDWLMAAATGTTSLFFTGEKRKPPPPPELPPPVEEVDAESKRKYTKQRMKSRKGRASTILATKNSGSKKTVLG